MQEAELRSKQHLLPEPEWRRSLLVNYQPVREDVREEALHTCDRLDRVREEGGGGALLQQL